MNRFFVILALGSGAALWSCGAQVLAPPRPLYVPQTEPKSDQIWTSTREIRALLPIFGSNGVRAATAGGVLEFDGKKWAKSTRRNGLPAHEALEISERLHQPIVRFPTFIAFRSGAKWESKSAPVWQKVARGFRWQNQEVRVSLDALQIGQKSFAMPPESNGTHISAVSNLGATLLVALYGDGLWSFNGQNWTRAAPVPSGAREITALAQDGGVLWLGTRRDGIFRRQGGKWQQFLQPNEPFDHNTQFFAEYGGVLWASTLDDGLICRTGSGWKHVPASDLSSSAPRQMINWKNRLYVRHGGGLVDGFDGRNWTKNVLSSIPRKGVYALASDQNTLFAAGWGGWSEWNGATWTPHFDLPELKGVPLMGLLLDGDNLYIATQSRGLGRYHRATKKFRWFDERDGMPDDWITTLAKSDGKIYAGTFVGGLARLDGEKWHVFEALKGQNVTAIVESGGKLFVSSRTGIWEVRGDVATKVEKTWLDSEVQALWAGKNGLWIGARTSLNWVLELGEKSGD